MSFAIPLITNPAAALRATISRFGPCSSFFKIEVMMDAFSLGSPPFKSVSSQGERSNSWGSILNSLTSLEFHSEILVSAA